METNPNVDAFIERSDKWPEETAARGTDPGRQREYNLYFSGAKQAKTREALFEKLSPKIVDGKGFRDR